MIVSGFGPGNLIASVFGFCFRSGSEHLLQLPTLLFQDAKRFFEYESNSVGNHIEEKFLWNAQREFERFCGNLA